MTDENNQYWMRWKASSGLPNMRWRVTRYREGGGGSLQELEASNGRLLTFKSHEAAKKRADELNALEAK